jgi:hypothetical protein
LKKSRRNEKNEKKGLTREGKINKLREGYKLQRTSRAGCNLVRQKPKAIFFEQVRT